LVRRLKFERKKPLWGEYLTFFASAVKASDTGHNSTMGKRDMGGYDKREVLSLYSLKVSEIFADIGEWRSRVVRFHMDLI
jgi:hypothetical protein